MQQDDIKEWRCFAAGATGSRVRVKTIQSMSVTEAAAKQQLGVDSNSVAVVAAACQHLLQRLCSRQREMGSGSGGPLKQVLPAVGSVKTKTINGGNGRSSQTATRCRHQQHRGVWRQHSSTCCRAFAKRSKRWHQVVAGL